jgi:hypothetical protein
MKRRSVRTGRVSSICSDEDFHRLGLTEQLPAKKYAVEGSTKVTDLFGLGTEELPKALRVFLLAFFHKAYQTELDLRLFFHPDYSPLDDANLIEVVNVVENSSRVPNRLDMEAGKVCAQDLMVRYAFCLHAHARAMADDFVSDVSIVEAFRAQGLSISMDDAREKTTDELWMLQGAFVCLFCTNHVLHWRRCMQCNARTCAGCVLYRDLAFGTSACGNCGSL